MSEDKVQALIDATEDLLEFAVSMSDLVVKAPRTYLRCRHAINRLKRTTAPDPRDFATPEEYNTAAERWSAEQRDYK